MKRFFQSVILSLSALFFIIMLGAVQFAPSEVQAFSFSQGGRAGNIHDIYGLYIRDIPTPRPSPTPTKKPEPPKPCDENYPFPWTDDCRECVAYCVGPGSESSQCWEDADEYCDSLYGDDEYGDEDAYMDCLDSFDDECNGIKDDCMKSNCGGTKP